MRPVGRDLPTEERTQPSNSCVTNTAALTEVNIALHRDPLETLLFAIALAMGLTPEYLPMIMTVTLAQGAVRMSREGVIVKRLASIQDLGSIDVLCSDKTNTLTTGALADPPPGGAGPARRAAVAYRASDGCRARAQGGRRAADAAPSTRATLRSRAATSTPRRSAVSSTADTAAGEPLRCASARA